MATGPAKAMRQNRGAFSHPRRRTSVQTAKIRIVRDRENLRPTRQRKSRWTSEPDSTWFGDGNTRTPRGKTTCKKRFGLLAQRKSGPLCGTSTGTGVKGPNVKTGQTPQICASHEWREQGNKVAPAPTKQREKGDGKKARRGDEKPRTGNVLGGIKRTVKGTHVIRA